MADLRLLRRLNLASDRLRLVRRLRAFTIGWIVFAAVLAISLATIPSRFWLGFIAIHGALIVIATGIYAGRKRADDATKTALAIERTFPELDARLLTAIQQPSQADESSYLQSELRDQVLRQWKRHDWNDIVPQSRMWGYWGAQALAFAGCLALAAMIPSGPYVKLSPSVAKSEPQRPVPVNGEVVIEPGNVDVEQGSSVVVVARFPKDAPESAELVARGADGRELRFPLSRSFNDPVFGGRIPSVDQRLTYHVEYDGVASPVYVILPYLLPDLVKSNVAITFPEYTDLERTSIEDVRRVSVVEGSTLDLECLLNKPVASAKLVSQDGAEIPLEADAERPSRVTMQWTPETPGETRFRLALVDGDGRKNREQPEIRVTVLPNRPPELKVGFPARDLRVSSLQELALAASASDDYGLKNLGLVLETPDGMQHIVDFGKTALPDQSVDAEHLLPLETLNVEAEQLVSYYFFAEDVGPDGELRRTASDMFFAEIRPFEEIYKQASAAPAEQGAPSGGQSNELLALQRQIVTGTWNLWRRGVLFSSSQEFAEDLGTLDESQIHVEKETEKLEQELNDLLMKQHAQLAIEHMRKAHLAFQEGLDTRQMEQVRQGHAAAQLAYRELLRLQSRERHVSNSQSSSSQGGGQRQSEELQALELKNDRDRYQTERQAQSEERQAGRESLQVLNRLKELARRQEDLTNRLKDLENAMRKAETEEERAEIERQLKRLQEEQESLLRDVDELRDRMNSDHNRREMAEARDQVDQTRERVLRASEALREGQSSRALTESARASRELNELAEDFRQQTSGQFDDKVRQLRDDVRNLAEEERKLSERLQSTAEPPMGQQRPSLRSDAPQDAGGELANLFEEQKQRLSSVLDEVKQLVEESETSEPLLSRRLYDSVRELRRFQPEEALGTAAQLVRYGIRPEAQRLEEQARRGIDKLQTGVEQAARSVLGNEDAALKLAQAELGELAQAIRNELDQMDPSGGESDQTGASSETSAEDASERSPAGETAQDSSSQGPNEESRDADERSSPNNGERQATSQGNEESAEQQQQQRSEEQGSRPMDSDSPGAAGNEPSECSGSEADSSQNSQGESPSNDANSRGARRGAAPAPVRSPGQLSPLDQLGPLLQQGGAGGGGGSGIGPQRPLTGDDFVEWSDRMRDVEEMLSTPELRSQASAIRDRARQMRIDVKRHSQAPEWGLVRTTIYGPMLELQQLVAQELARRSPSEQLVPIDRDPVPEKYAPLVQEYYRQLSRQQPETQTQQP